MRNKFLLVMTVLLCMVVVFGCRVAPDSAGSKIISGNDQGGEESLPFVEIETGDMVEIPRHTWSPPVSSPQGMILLKYPEENAVFECVVEKGCLYNSQQPTLKNQEVIVKPGSTIYWEPFFEIYPIPEQDFVYIIVKTGDKIIGYAVIGINMLGEYEYYELKLLKSALIPKVDGEYQTVTEEQIKAAIEKAKKGKVTI